MAKDTGPVVKAQLAELGVDSMEALYALPKPPSGTVRSLVWDQLRSQLLKVEQYEASRLDSLKALARATVAAETNAAQGLTLHGTLASYAAKVDEYEQKLNDTAGQFREWLYVWKNGETA